MVPATTTDLEVAQRGTQLQFAFSYPAVTIGGLPLPGLEAVELWRLTRPLQPQPEVDEEGPEGVAEEEESIEVVPAEEEPPPDEPATPSSPFLFQRPVAEEEVQAENRIQVDPREFLALAALELRIEGAELQAAINGDRVLLRLPLGELPPEETPEEERDIELFAVISISSRGLSSELSNLATILPRTPPPPPSQLDTRPSDNGIELVWRADEPPLGFNVYRRDAASRAYGEPLAELEPDALAYFDRTARFETRYVYSVTSVALDEPLVESALAVEHEVDYQDRYPPVPPTGLIVFAEPGRVRLLWEPSPADDLAGYLIYRQGEGGAGFERLRAEPGLELEYEDTAVSSGRGYSYYVSAVDLSGNESEASETADVEVP
jgi:hypothetical protein